MKKTVVALWVLDLVLMLADGWLTFLNTPDLSNEGNPLVAVFGFGWAALVLANLLVFAFFLWVTWFAFVCYSPLVVEAETYWQYQSQIYFNRPDRYRWFFYKLPKNWKPFWAMCGWGMGFALPAARAVLVFEWLVITLCGGFGRASWYPGLRRAVPFGRVDLLAALCVAVCAMALFSGRDYRENQRLYARGRAEGSPM